MSSKKATRQQGIEARHSKACASRTDSRCNCTPTYQAGVWDARNAKPIKKTFKNLSAAKLWRQDALVALRKGTLSEARPKTSVKEACEAWLADARAGMIRTRGGDAFKPATLRAYEQGMRLRVYPELGTAPFYRVRRVHLQDLVGRLLASGTAPATINTTLGALGAIYGHAVQRDELEVSPTMGVKLPAVRNGRLRFATREEANALLAAVPDRDRPVWATAMYAGLRRGELMALRPQDLDLAAGTINVQRGWDEHGATTPKNGKPRTVPIIATLREILVAQLLCQPPGTDLVFGLAPYRPFRADRLQQRADGAWKAAGLTRLTLHDCRHTYASFAIAAGVNAKALSTYMGHSSVAITFDRYGHLMPGSETEAAGLLDAYLETTG
jgi:integrase